MKRKKIPKATVQRLPLYARCLDLMAKRGLKTISSPDLSERIGIKATQLRKDLSYIGEFGTPGVGYNVSELLWQIQNLLGVTKSRNVALVGAGRLGQALMGYRGFEQKGFKIAAVFDSDKKKIGAQIAGHQIHSMDEFAVVSEESDIEIAIIATPPNSAQLVATQVTLAGIKSIMNFAPIALMVPNDVVLRQVDLAIELQILAFYQTEAEREGHKREDKH